MAVELGKGDTLRVAVITGGHDLDVIGFHHLFRSLEGIDAYTQHMDDFGYASEEVRDSYDVVLFFIMLEDGPTDEGIPWYAGKPRTALEHLGETGQGIVVLHHAILAYPDWQVWSDLTDLPEPRGRLDDCEHDVTLLIEIANPDHPITEGLSAFEIVDESYRMGSASEGSDVLLVTHDPQSMESIGWTRQHKKSRVFCFQSGHDALAWTNPSFKEVLLRGIRWVANR